MKTRETKVYKKNPTSKSGPARKVKPAEGMQSLAEDFAETGFSSASVSYQLDVVIESFLRQAVAKSAFNIQDKKLTFADLLADRMLMVLAIKEGIPFRVFRLIQKLSPFTMNEWGAFLNLSTKSIQRYQQSNTRFKPIYSEKIVELAEVIKTGIEIFDTMDQFKLWLDTPNFALGKQKPIDLLSDSYGKDLVLGELIRTDQGIFA